MRPSIMRRCHAHLVDGLLKNTRDTSVIFQEAREGKDLQLNWSRSRIAHKTGMSEFVFYR